MVGQTILYAVYSTKRDCLPQRSAPLTLSSFVEVRHVAAGDLGICASAVLKSVRIVNLASIHRALMVSGGIPKTCN
jgi:hypothetical protein